MLSASLTYGSAMQCQASQGIYVGDRLILSPLKEGGSRPQFGQHLQMSAPAPVLEAGGAPQTTLGLGRDGMPVTERVHGSRGGRGAAGGHRHRRWTPLSRPPTPAGAASSGSVPGGAGIPGGSPAPPAPPCSASPFQPAGEGGLLPAWGFPGSAAQHMVYMLHHCTQGLTLSPGIHLT